MLYFWPQLETKVLNEGWATYWHMRIMREMDLSEAEAVEFARMHADRVGTVADSNQPVPSRLLHLAGHLQRWETSTARNGSDTDVPAAKEWRNCL